MPTEEPAGGAQRPVRARAPRAEAGAAVPGAAATQPARPAGAEPSAAPGSGPADAPALPAEPSAKRLRALLRASPLVAPELRAHWLRVLPHLSAAQRAELAALLEAGAPAGRAPDPAHARRP